MTEEPQHWIIWKEPKTLNQTLRLKKWERVQYFRDVYVTTRLCIGQIRAPAFKGKATVRYLVARGGRTDPDQRLASMKPYTDALVKAGWLEDDDEGHVNLLYDEIIERDRRSRRVDIYWKPL